MYVHVTVHERGLGLELRRMVNVTMISDDEAQMGRNSVCSLLLVVRMGVVEIQSAMIDALVCAWGGVVGILVRWPKAAMYNASVQKCFRTSFSSDANADQREKSSRGFPACFFF